ncbi:hypothetical protein MO973_31040 [Paenibacillus sp. TRM 82003]|nr:hypothetical protein [Paenibacillus sp. TRM 82003]
MSELGWPAIADEVTAEIYQAYPEFAKRYGEVGKKKCYEDNLYHLKYLETAYVQDRTDIFTEYALWLNRVLTARGMKAEHLIDNFERLSRVSEGKLEPSKEKAYKDYLRAAIRALKETE